MTFTAPTSVESAPNNSFKPRPLRGSACVLACSTPPFRAAVRLNSGVRPVQKEVPVNKRQAQLGLFFPRLSQALILATNSVPARAPALRFWVRLARKERLSALDSGQIDSLVKSNGWHRSNNSFKPSPLRGLVQVLASFTCPRPQIGPA